MDIRLGTISRRDIADPVITRFIDDVASLMKAELLQAISTQGDQGPNVFRPGTIRAGVKKSVEYDSVAKVAVEKWYPRLDAAKQQAALRAIPRALQADQRLRAGLQAPQLNLRSAKPVIEQFDLTQRFAGVDLNRLIGRVQDRIDAVVIPAASGGAGGGTIVANKGLDFRVNSVKCIDETEPEFFGKDTIAMGGTAVDDRERVTKINQFTVGDFDDGDQVTYGPNVLKSFNLSGGTYPKLFTVFLAIAEKDAGGFGDFLNALYEAVKAELVVIITTLSVAAGGAIGAAIGGTTGTALGGPIGAAIGIITGLIVGALIAWIANVAQDDLFEPQLSFIELPSASATFANGSLTSPTLRFNYADFGGQYRVNYSWQLAQQ